MLLSDVLIIDATDRLGWLAGRVLADLGADVIKIEPANGDPTRRRIGFAAGFFATFAASPSI